MHAEQQPCTEPEGRAAAEGSAAATRDALRTNTASSLKTTSRLTGIDVSTVDALTPKIIKIGEIVDNFLGESP